MSKFMYQANFNITNEVTNEGFVKANRDLNSFTDVSEWATEAIFKRQFNVDVSAELVDTTSGIVTVSSPKPLTNGQLQSIAKVIEANLETLEVGLMTETPTLSGYEYTAINWQSDVNRFGAIKTY